MASQERTNVKISGASTNNTVVAAVSGHKIRVLSYVVVGSGTYTATFRSFDGSSTYTVLTGAMTLVAGLPVVKPLEVEGHFETLSGEALVLTLSATTQTSGHMTYALIPA